MSAASDGYRVGYGHPPLKTRWKKGQSGDSRRRKPKRRRSTVEIIDKMLFVPVQVTLNGETETVPTIRAIIFQLMQKAGSGNVRPARVLQKYRDFASQNLETKPELTFVKSDYTRAFAKQNGSDNDA